MFSTSNIERFLFKSFTHCNCFLVYEEEKNNAGDDLIAVAVRAGVSVSAGVSWAHQPRHHQQ